MSPVISAGSACAPLAPAGTHARQTEWQVDLDRRWAERRTVGLDNFNIEGVVTCP
jgi:hypothetical protein